MPTMRRRNNANIFFFFKDSKQNTKPSKLNKSLSITQQGESCDIGTKQSKPDCDEKFVYILKLKLISLHYRTILIICNKLTFTAVGWK